MALGGARVVGFLEGVRVVDFGQYVAGPVAAMLLADQGADVVRVERPGGPSLDTPANATWNRGKRSICLDLSDPSKQLIAKGLAVKADIVIENFRPGVMGRLGLGYPTIRTLNPRLIYASMPAFGRNDRRCNVQGWEGVVLAAADVFRPRTEYRNMMGQIHTDPVDRDGRPLFTDEPVASMYAALVAKMGILSALIVRERSGQGQLVEAPLFDSFMQSVGILGMAKSPFRRPSMDSLGPWDHQYQCADGRWVHIVCTEETYARSLAELLGASELIEHQLTNADHIRTREQSNRLHEVLTEAFMSASAAEWETRFEANAIPGAICRSTEEWLSHPQAAAGLTITVNDPTLGLTTQPGPIVAISEVESCIDRPAPTPDQHCGELLAEIATSDPFEDPSSPKIKVAANIGRPLSGLRVLDLSTGLAGPTCGRTLAELGADVIKVNDLEQSKIPFHHDVNRGKRSILLNLETSEGLKLLLSLMDRADIVVENFRPGVAESLGIDYESVNARKPATIYCSTTAFGNKGPWSEMPGYEETVAAATGFQNRTGDQGSPRVWSYPSVTENGTGLAAASGVLLALLERSTTGKGQRVESALARTAGIFQSRDVIDFKGRQWNKSEHYETGLTPVYGLYQCQDRWIFLGTPSRDAIIPLLGETVESADGFALQLREWCRRRSASEAVRRLLENNIGAQELVWLNDVMMDPQVVRAGLSVIREHDGVGLLRTTGPGSWLSESTVAVGRPAPIPGHDIASVLIEIGRLNDLGALLRCGAVVSF